MYHSGGSGSEEENDGNNEKEDKSHGNKQIVEASDEDDEDDDDENEDNDDTQIEVTAGATLTVGDLIQAMKTKKKIPVSQPSSVVSHVFLPVCSIRRCTGIMVINDVTLDIQCSMHQAFSPVTV